MLLLCYRFFTASRRTVKTRNSYFYSSNIVWPLCRYLSCFVWRPPRRPHAQYCSAGSCSAASDACKHQCMVVGFVFEAIAAASHPSPPVRVRVHDNTTCVFILWFGSQFADFAEIRDRCTRIVQRAASAAAGAGWRSYTQAARARKICRFIVVSPRGRNEMW